MGRGRGRGGSATSFVKKRARLRDCPGGGHLEAAIANANKFARFPLCGMIGQYNGAPEGPRNIYEVILKSIRMQGFIASDHLDLLADFHRDVGGWVREGRVKWQETVVDGLDNAPQPFLTCSAAAISARCWSGWLAELPERRSSKATESTRFGP